MKIYEFALLILILSAVSGFYNTMGIFDYQYEEINVAVNETEIDTIYEIDMEGNIKTDDMLLENSGDANGFSFILKTMSVVSNALGMALNIGGVCQSYIGGVIGYEIALLINGLTYFVYGWGGLQLYRRVSTRDME